MSDEKITHIYDGVQGDNEDLMERVFQEHMEASKRALEEESAAKALFFQAALQSKIQMETYRLVKFLVQCLGKP